MAIPINPVPAVLQCHPGTCNQAVHGIELCVGWTQGGELSLTYVLKGDIASLRIPLPRPPRRADHLWEHTCFEAFVGVKGKVEYYEFNFAPSGEWAAYFFRSYRDGAPIDNGELAPKITVGLTEDSLEIDAIVRMDCLRTIQPRERLRLALSAVIEENDGMLSYWALKHPPGKPDFHHPDAFALEIEPPNAESLNESPMVKR